MRFQLDRHRAAVLIAGLIFILFLTLIRYELFLDIPNGDGKIVKIFDFSEGYTLKRIAGELERSGIISSAGLFTIHARLSGADEKVKAGAYLFNDGMTPPRILYKLVAGEIYARRFSVPEGYSIYQIAEMLDQRGLFRKEAFLRQCVNPEILSRFGIGGGSVEGYLYPVTYDITPKMDEASLVGAMVARFDKEYGRRFAARVRAGNRGIREIVTIASMVEKEAKVPAERPLIASVFYNRLKMGMPLQSDPTAVYGVRAFAGKVTHADVLRPTPYNTYLIRGLPPGPIGNPGADAIEAAVNPAATPYLYFVAKQDGSHYFSTTLDEHNRAVRRYLGR